MKSAALPTAMILGLALAVAGCAQFGLQESAVPAQKAIRRWNRFADEGHG
jgi:hypothetical protein